MSIRLHAGQSEVFSDLFIDKVCRFSVVNCSRGWGKSYEGATVANAALFELMNLDASVPNKNVYLCAPTHDQVTDIYWPILENDFCLTSFAYKHYRDKGKMRFPGNVELILLSYEAIERMRGKGCYTFIWDEVSSCVKGIEPKEAWENVIQPTMSTRWSPKRAALYKAPSAGRGLFIGTPKGYNYFYDLHNMHEVDDRWKSYTFDYTTSPFLDPEEIERLRHNLDPITFAREYKASFVESGNNVFYCFDRASHVTDKIAYFQPPDGTTRGEDVHVSIDFNVGVMCASSFALRGGQMHFQDEFRGHPDTETLGISLKAKYPNHKIYAYPDPSGRARKTSAAVGITDFSILQSMGIECLARPKAPPIIDSVACVNRMLKTAAGSMNMFFHPRCKNLIASMERTRWLDNNMDTATLDKSEGIEHYSDGVRYATEFLFPIMNGSPRVRRGFNF